MSLIQVRVKKMFFKVAIKSPILLLVVVAVTLFSILYLSTTCTLDVYKEFQGQVKATNQNSPYIEVLADVVYYKNLDTKSMTSWYIDKQTGVYSAHISEVEIQNDNLSVKVIPTQEGRGFLEKLKNKSSKKVFIKIKVGSEKLLDRLFRKEVNIDEGK